MPAPRPSSQPSRHTAVWLLLLLTLIAFGLRMWQLGEAPPGWRDDELINSLVISQKVIDGDWRLYYDDASGHEALYHALNGFMLARFGPNVFGIRWLSVILGTLAVPMCYAVAWRMTGSRLVALTAAAGLTFSFWSLMYSRTGIRHISLPFMMLPVVYYFWGMLYGRLSQMRQEAIWGGLWMGGAFYTYFASRGIPLILIAFLIYLLIVDRQRVVERWRAILLMLALAFGLAMPLVWTLQQQPIEMEGRVEELAVPITAARDGEFAPLQEHVVRTLNMFHSDGDEEYLYNLRQRPIFSPLGATAFWLGVGLALLLIGQSFWLHFSSATPSSRRPNDQTPAAGFLLLWVLAGISPAFLSIPPASLSHTILAQAGIYIFMALPLVWLINGLQSRHQFNWVAPTVALILVLAVAWRDLPDYFLEWPAHPSVRFLYRADIHDAADYLIESELTDIGITGLLAGSWDKLALDANLGPHADQVNARWYFPERVLLLNPAQSLTQAPAGLNYFESAAYTTIEPTDGMYELAQIDYRFEPQSAEPICFENGLCAAWRVSQDNGYFLDVLWSVAQPLQLPEKQLVSNPPPPGVYSGPRLVVFAQMLTAEGQYVTGDDGLWIDPYTLEVGDSFVQRHIVFPPDGAIPATIAFGLYDPFDGRRILTQNSTDAVLIPLQP